MRFKLLSKGITYMEACGTPFKMKQAAEKELEKGMIKGIKL